MKPSLLDLFCGAGGAAKGYQRAGFYVVGVDIKAQPHYCGDEFHQSDAMTFPLNGFDAIHASPVCERFTATRHLGIARNGEYPEHPNFIPETRRRLIGAGVPFVIENVCGARRELIKPIMLCGTMFGLKVYRHRLFECPIFVMRPKHAPHRDRTPSAGNGKSPKGFISVCGSGGIRGFKAHEIVPYWSKAMGIDWMEREELAKSIPPAYTEFIGRQLMAVIERAA